MSSTNKTTNYELSQYVGSDKPTYLGDYNSDMLKIDAQMKVNATAAATADAKAVTADGKAVTADGKAVAADEKATTAGSTATSALNKALANETDIVALKAANNYSTTETVCGKWKNGKPIYRKIVTYTIPTGTYSDNKSLTIANCDEMTNLTYYIDKDNLRDYGDYYVGQNDYQRCFIYKDTNTLELRIRTSINVGYTTVSGLFILEYTKTTD